MWNSTPQKLTPKVILPIIVWLSEKQDMYYKGVLNEQIVYILFFYILRDAGNCSEYGRHLSTSSSVIVSDADS